MNNYKETVNKFSEEQIRTILTQERPIDACRLLDCSIKIYYKLLNNLNIPKKGSSVLGLGMKKKHEMEYKEIFEKHSEDEIITILNESRNGREVMCKLGCTRKSYFELFNYFYNKIFENFKADEIRKIVLNNRQEEACKILKCTHYGYQKLQDYLYDDIFKRFKEDEIISILQNNKKHQACEKLGCSERNYNKLLYSFRTSMVLSPDLQVKKEKKEEYERIVNTYSKEDLLKILTTNSPKDACSILKCRDNNYYQLLKEFNLPFQGKINYVNGMKRKHENKYNDVFKRFTEDQIKEILVKEDRGDSCKLLNVSKGIYYKLLEHFNLPTKVGQRRNTTFEYTDEQLIELYKKYNGNIVRLVEEEKIERGWVIRARLEKLGYTGEGNTESRPSWCKGLTKETSTGLRKISEKLKEGYRTGRLSNINAILIQASNKTPSTEKKVMKILDELNIKYDHQKPMGRLVPDFVIEDKKLIIQVQGCFWHRCQICSKKVFSKNELYEQRLREIKQVKFFSERGYRTLFIWEHELKNLEEVKLKILRFLKI
jgi:DNA mismatch endonuclease (patch repair protein)